MTPLKKADIELRDSYRTMLLKGESAIKREEKKCVNCSHFRPMSMRCYLDSDNPTDVSIRYSCDFFAKLQYDDL